MLPGIYIYLDNCLFLIGEIKLNTYNIKQDKVKQVETTSFARNTIQSLLRVFDDLGARSADVRARKGDEVVAPLSDFSSEQSLSWRSLSDGSASSPSSPSSTIVSKILQYP